VSEEKCQNISLAREGFLRVLPPRHAEDSGKNHSFLCRYTQVDETASCHGMRIAEAELETMLYEVLSKQAQIILNVSDLAGAGALDVQIAKQTEYSGRIEECLDAENQPGRISSAKGRD